MKSLFSKQYEYQATESAPINYPMEIISGSLIYHDGSGSLYVPAHVIVANGWGDGRSNHILSDSDHPLPNRLRLTFYSYTEDQFYRGDFELPYERIKALFEKGFYSRVDEAHITYDLFTVGVAPGGIVTVWLSNYDRRLEILFGQAEKIEGDWEWVLNNPEADRKAYIQRVIEHDMRTPEALADYQKNGPPLGRWTRYHEARYRWQPVLTGMRLRDDLINYIHFYNGEDGYLNIPLDEDFRDQTLAIPNKVSLIWNRTGYLVNDMVIEAFFDETEIFHVFETVAKDGEPMEMEFRMEPEKNYDFTIWIRNSRQAVELKKTEIKTWKPGGMRYENAKPTDTE